MMVVFECGDRRGTIEVLTRFRHALGLSAAVYDGTAAIRAKVLVGALFRQFQINNNSLGLLTYDVCGGNFCIYWTSRVV